MRQIEFPAEVYEEKIVNEDAVKIAGVTPKRGMICKNEYKCGLFELMDTMLIKLNEKKLDRKAHKTNKKLQRKIRELGRFRDDDEDSLILPKGGTLLIEDSEWDLLKEMLDSATQKVPARYSGLLDDLWDLVDSAKEFSPKPELVKIDNT